MFLRVHWLGLLGDAALVLEALIEELANRLPQGPRGRAAEIAQLIRAVKEPWLTNWLPRLTSSSSPLSPYRVIWDLYHTIDLDRTIITHDAITALRIRTAQSAARVPTHHRCSSTCACGMSGR